jgi:hypothetical protein
MESDKSQNKAITVRISPEVLALIRQHVDGKHGHGYLITKAVKAYFGK